MAELIVKSAVRGETGDMNVSSDFYDALDSEVESLLLEAAQRARNNGRVKVEPKDL